MGKSITSCPQLVSVPLTGIERMVSSSLNMALVLPTSKGFTSLIAYCSCGRIGTTFHYDTECILTVSWKYEEASPKLRTRMAEKCRQ
ncbi:hypothetical protein AVEN_5623-1 [Araneus ventricosus]|uniref:Uncharacterized protein n=1 Tax=Araneus ventricosus TaxID=182803 RepID=A0A4Y2JVV0_ARAVE|nr:hypothetical protein AVEN_5623-1 [Araneus ventricosus]